MKTLLVGERANSEHWRPKNVPEYGRAHVEMLRSLGAFKYRGDRVTAYDRLIELGLRWDDALNLCWPDPPQAAWDKEHARKTASVVRQYFFQEYDCIVMCGLRVARAFEHYAQIPMLVVCTPMQLLVPHPSGRSRAWNDPETAVLVKQLWRAAEYGITTPDVPASQP